MDSNLFLSDEPPFKFEIILLFGSCAAITIIACLVPFVLTFTSFYIAIRPTYYWIYVTEFIGTLIASILYLQKILAPLKEQRHRVKVQESKATQEEMKSQQKELVKENKLMKKKLSKTKAISKNKSE